MPKMTASFFPGSVFILSGIYLLVGMEHFDRALSGWQEAWHSVCCQRLRLQQTFSQIGHNMVVFIRTVHTLQGHSKSHFLPQGLLVKGLQSLALGKE